MANKVTPILQDGKIDALASGDSLIDAGGNSIFPGVKYIQIQVFDLATSLTTGDGKAKIDIPASMDGMNLVSVYAKVDTAGTTNTTDIQIRNITKAADMLSTKLTIDSTETSSATAATAAVIDTAHDDVSANDELAADIDAVSTTAPKGLRLTLGFRKP